LWTLPHPEQAIDEWIRVLRPGGRLIVVDSKADVSSSKQDHQITRRFVRSPIGAL
jgi:ubiquinone/menaquinone biosynthesis C-methylase UbiE